MTKWHGGKGSKQRPTDNNKYRENYDKVFSYKNKLQDMTELNGDGNRERGRYGEDNSKDSQ